LVIFLKDNSCLFSIRTIVDFRIQLLKLRFYNEYNVVKSMDQEKSKISINNFMTPNVKSIQSSISIKEAAKIMYEQHIPSLLIEENDKVVGIITYADIALALAIFDHKLTTQIREIMSSQIISVTSDHSILKVVELMLEKRIHKIPVIDNEKIQGIISATDLMALFSMLSEKQIYNVVKGQIEKI